MKAYRMRNSFKAVLPALGLALLMGGLAGLPRAYAVGDAGPGLVIIMPEEDDGYTLESKGYKALTCGSSGDPGDYPEASFTASCCSGRSPYEIQFTDTSQAGNGGPITDRLWTFRGSDFSDAQNPAYTFQPFGFFKVTLQVKNQAGLCDTCSAFVFSELYAPTPDDETCLSALESLTGMREMIAWNAQRFPNSGRAGFFLGTAEYDGVWYGWPLKHIPAPAACGGEGEPYRDMHRNWSCTEGCVDEDYCSSDPNLTVVPYGGEEGEGNCGEGETCSGDLPGNGTIDPLPLHNEAIASYIAHEFNTLSTANSLIPYGVARRGVWVAEGEGEGEYECDYAFDVVDGIVDNRGDMDMYGLHLIYWLPAWTAYGGGMGRFDADDMEDFILEHIQTVIGRYTQGGAQPFKHWNVANEIIDDNLTTGSAQSIYEFIRTENPLGSSPARRESQGGLSPKYYWPYYVLSSENTNRANAATVFKSAYTTARAADATARLIYTDYGCEFRYGSYGSTPGSDQWKYTAQCSLIDEFASGSIPLDDVAIQSHMAAWQFLVYDTAGENSLRLAPKQLISMRESISGIAKRLEGCTDDPGVIISELDIRIGVPADSEPDNKEEESIINHLKDQFGIGHPEAWRALSLVGRRTWQGRIYEALLNACLAAPALRGVIFWDICDETHWLSYTNTASFPFTPPYLLSPSESNDKSCQAALFGRKLDCYDAGRMMFYPKPAYYGVRNAITNYFGEAFCVKNVAAEGEGEGEGEGEIEGEEKRKEEVLVRFVENGNVLMMKKDATVEENVTTGNWPETGDLCFALLMPDCSFLAAVDSDGNLYLKGTVMQFQTSVQMNVSNPPFKIQRKSDDVVVSLIDGDGNLRMREEAQTAFDGEYNPPTGYLLIYGIPYNLDLTVNPTYCNDTYAL